MITEHILPINDRDVVLDACVGVRTSRQTDGHVVHIQNWKFKVVTRVFSRTGSSIYTTLAPRRFARRAKVLRTDGRTLKSRGSRLKIIHTHFFSIWSAPRNLGNMSLSLFALPSGKWQAFLSHQHPETCLFSFCIALHLPPETCLFPFCIILNPYPTKTQETCLSPCMALLHPST